MIEKTNAVVLRVRPFSKTSHVVVWLSAEFGKLSTLVKGACRPRSDFLGQYDLFYTCELIFYHHKAGRLHIARECSPLSSRDSLRNDWKAYACASYFSDLVIRTTPDAGAQAETYRLLNVALDSLARGAQGPQLLFWFELQLLKSLGMRPRLGNCAVCGAAAALSNVVMDASRGGAICSQCVLISRNKPMPDSPTLREKYEVRPIRSDVLEVLNQWAESSSPGKALAHPFSPPQLMDARRVIGSLLRHHLDIPPASRRIALQLVDINRLSWQQAERENS